MTESTTHNVPNAPHHPNQDTQGQERKLIDRRPLFGPQTNEQPGPDEREAVVGDADLPRRAAGSAGEQAGSGVPGLGGAPGGTSNYGGVGLPGGAQRLGEGAAPSDDPRLGGTAATGGLGIGGQPASGLGDVGETEVLPGGATRPAGGIGQDTNTSGPSQQHDYTVKHADQGALEPGHGAMMNAEPGGSGANNISTRGDEAITMQRSARGGPHATPSPPPDSASDGGPAQSGSLAENPQPDPTQDQR